MKIPKASKLDLKFHCSKRVLRSCKKSKQHNVSSQCQNVMKVISLFPERGVSIPRFSKLRKMRVPLPHLSVGKSGGYRLIYRTSIIDEIRYVVFLEVYFKGKKDDLTSGEYSELLNESEEILEDPLSFDWDDQPKLS